MRVNRNRQNEISRERILNASLEEFGKKDYSLASVNSICKTNNISKGLLFHYYKNKDELFLICVEKLFIDLTGYLKKNIQFGFTDLKENLRSFIEKRFEFFEKYPCYKQIFYTATFNPPGHLQHEINLLKEPVQNLNRFFWNEVIKDLPMKPDFTIEEVLEIIINLGDYIHLKNRNNLTKNDFDNPEVIDQYTREYMHFLKMLFYGVADR